MSSKIFKVKHDAFVSTVGEYLRTNETVKPIQNYDIIKTSRGKECSPQDINWYYVRAASVLRKLLIADYNEKSLTVNKIASQYGCAMDRGNRPSKHVRGAKGIIVKILKDFIQLGWVKEENFSYAITSKGKALASDLIEKILN